MMVDGKEIVECLDCSSAQLSACLDGCLAVVGVWMGTIAMHSEFRYWLYLVPRQLSR